IAEDVCAPIQRPRDPSCPRPDLVIAVLQLPQAKIDERLRLERRIGSRALVGLGEAPGGALSGQDVLRFGPRRVAELEGVSIHGGEESEEVLDQGSIEWQVRRTLE